MIWLTWRQHRAAIIGAAVFVVALVVVLAAFWSLVRELNAGCAEHDCWIGVAGALGGQLEHIQGAITYGPPVLAGVVAVFWGAPMLAREYEQRTYLVAWGQDLTAGRWLASRSALLAGGAVLLAVPLALVSWLLVDAMRTSGLWNSAVSPYQTLDLWPPIQVLHTLLGLTLGAAVGVFLRRTPVAMGTTLVAFVAIRLVIAATALRWLPPERQVTELGAPSDLPAGAVRVGAGYLDVDNEPVTVPVVCGDKQCLVDRGVRHAYLDYQPFDRLDAIRWAEVIVYALLTAGLVGLAWSQVRRTRRVG